MIYVLLLSGEGVSKVRSRKIDGIFVGEEELISTGINNIFWEWWIMSDGVSLLEAQERILFDIVPLVHWLYVFWRRYIGALSK